MGILENRKLMLEQIKTLKGQINEALTTKDKKVVKAFYDQKPLEGKLLNTDGKVLEKKGMGRQNIAHWRGSYVIVTATSDSKSTDSIVRFLKKYIPSGRLKNKEKVEYKVELVDAYQGQSNYELGMYINGDIAGMVEYVIYGKDLTVSDIVVIPKYRRMGFGSRMMQYIKQYHKGEATYRPSMKTDLGTKFKHKKIKNIYNLD